MSVPVASWVSARSVEVCYVRTGECAEQFLPGMLPQLTADEQARARRFAFAKDCLAFALGRVLVRRTLSRYAVAPPGGWEFVCNAYGKPGLRPSPEAPPFRFSIAHCTGMVAAGFALGREIGVDVETLDRRVAGPEIARSHFAPDENRFLESLPEGERPHAFLALWTLKEAYIKARGMGVSIPLADFAFTLEPLRIAFSPQIKDQPSNWYFLQSNLAPAHVLAVAVEREPEEEVSVSIREVGLESLQDG